MQTIQITSKARLKNINELLPFCVAVAKSASKLNISLTSVPPRDAAVQKFEISLNLYTIQNNLPQTSSYNYSYQARSTKILIEVVADAKCKETSDKPEVIKSDIPKISKVKENSVQINKTSDNEYEAKQKNSQVVFSEINNYLKSRLGDLSIYPLELEAKTEIKYSIR